MKIIDLKMNMLVQHRHEMLKVGTIEQEFVTAELVYPHLPGERTTVRFYLASEVEQWDEPTDAMVGKYERAWGFA